MFVILIGSKWSEASEFAVKIKRRSVVNDRVNIEFQIRSNFTVEPLLYQNNNNFVLENDYYMQKLYTVHDLLNSLKSIFS